jgi:hypothetical protein
MSMHLPWKPSLFAALGAGTVLGTLILGVGGRLAMRVIAVLDGTPVGFSVGGSMTVVFLGAVAGAAGGLVLWVTRRVFPRAPLARGVVFWGALTFLTLRGLNPVSVERLLVFAPLILVYGASLYRVWCRRYVRRWMAVPAIV